MHKYIISHFVSLILGVLFLMGCQTVKNVPYFQNADTFDGTQGAYLYDMTIKPKDMLRAV